MKLIIEVDEKLFCEGLLRNFTEEERDILIRAVRNGVEYVEPKKGKWIKVFENPFTNGYVCPFCGHKIQVTEQFLPEVIECESCGADMREGEEE